MGEVDSSPFFSHAKILKVKIHSLDLRDSEFDAADGKHFFSLLKGIHSTHTMKVKHFSDLRLIKESSF